MGMFPRTSSQLCVDYSQGGQWLPDVRVLTFSNASVVWVPHQDTSAYRSIAGRLIREAWHMPRKCRTLPSLYNQSSVIISILEKITDFWMLDERIWLTAQLSRPLNFRHLEIYRCIQLLRCLNDWSWCTKVSDTKFELNQ